MHEVPGLLRISFSAGEAEQAAVSFTGVGLELGGIQQEEFRNSIAGTRNAYYVTDLRRHWYNGIVLEQVARVLNDDMRTRRITCGFTLGNSMGGTGAILFAGLLDGCGTAIAFAPQSSVHPELVPFETRWREWRGSIASWTIPDAADGLSSSVLYILFFGLGDKKDVRHADRFLAHNRSNLAAIGVRKCRHDVAAHLKKKGVSLGCLIEAAHSKGIDGVRHTLDRARGLDYRLMSPPKPG